VKIRSLFISTELPKDNELRLFCLENKIELRAESLLSFDPVGHNSVFNGDVIFFSSIRCFQYYKGDIQNKILAVYGQGTVKKILKYHPELKSQIQFIGGETNNPETISKELMLWLGNRTVLFPIGTKSLKSISKYIPKSQVEEQIVYTTKLNPKSIDLVDACMFTSPSNVESYLQINEIQKDIRYIAWGKSTFSKMKDLGYVNVVLLEESSYSSLIRFIQSES
jgi:uroporphyrinogen-III synthase